MSTDVALLDKKREALERARHLLGDGHWCKYAFAVAGGNGTLYYCLAEAVDRSASYCGVPLTERPDLFRRIVLAARWSGRHLSDPRSTAIGWNDARARTYDDVMKAIEGAIKSVIRDLEG